VTERQTLLQRELRQRRPFESPAHEALLGLFRTADAAGRAVAAAIEPHGITGQQFNVLRILRGAQPDPLPTLEIGERMIEQTPGITRLLDRLEAKGLVARVRSSEDRRVVNLELTDAGREVAAVVPAVLAEVLNLHLAGFSHDEWRALLSMLKRMRANGDTLRAATSPNSATPD